MRYQRMTLDEHRRQLRQIRQQAVPLRATGIAQLPNGAIAPIVSLNADRHPDVADLVRVHMTEAPEEGGDVNTTWGIMLSNRPDQPSYAALRTDMIRPVRCTFWMLFDFDRHDQFLVLLAKTQLLLLTTVAEPEKHPDLLNWTLAYQVGTDDLHRALTMLAARDFAYQALGGKARRSPGDRDGAS